MDATGPESRGTIILLLRSANVDGDSVDHALWCIGQQWPLD
jgi:hypothetical protein